jgi:acyl-CoA synthetase (AMP-forming)/AMP-acid ligase II
MPATQVEGGSRTLGDVLGPGPAPPKADALVLPGRRLSRADLGQAARRWAKALVAAGVAPGAHVGLLFNSGSDFVEAMFGVAMAGAVAVPINARYQPRELAYLVENADLVALIVDGAPGNVVDFEARLAGALPALADAVPGAPLALAAAPRLRRIIATGRTADEGGFVAAAAFLAAGDAVAGGAVDRRLAATSPDSVAIILYTSGTTANPKGCLITHRGMIGNARALAARYGIGAGDRFWSPLPSFHIAGILPLVAALDVGAAYLTQPTADAGVALDLLGREGATHAYPCFVTIMQDLINHPRFASTDLSRVRLMNSNLAVQPPWIAHAIAAAMPGAAQVGTYGLTEGVGTICTSRPDDPEALRLGRLGTPLEGWEVRVIDPISGIQRPAGEQGEIVARGPHAMKGYYRDPAKTAATFDAEGWMRTGDIGSIDASGHIMFHGRLKDMLKVGGENVAAVEIEAVLDSHPAVQLSQVVGMPDPRYEEAPAAFVELKTGATASEAELIAFCEGKLARFKIPRLVRFIGEWPMSATKIQKFKLRDDLLKTLAKSNAA